jgi:hypothetical protein
MKEYIEYFAVTPGQLLNFISTNTSTGYVGSNGCSRSVTPVPISSFAVEP